jgi:hypothetical protein
VCRIFIGVRFKVVFESTDLVSERKIFRRIRLVDTEVGNFRST